MLNICLSVMVCYQGPISLNASVLTYFMHMACEAQHQNELNAQFHSERAGMGEILAGAYLHIRDLTSLSVKVFKC